ncbi:MAG: hypothetical protein QXO20_06270 [Candidatus Bathyarchaeia archaeon]
MSKKIVLKRKNVADGAPAMVVADKEACEVMARCLHEYLVRMPLYKMECLK